MSDNNQNKIKFAVVGQGHIGKRHAEMVRRNPGCELVAVCDLLPKEQLGLDNLEEKYYNSLDDLLKAHPEVEVINVCTPNGLHSEHALKALDHNKHVVVEKPMALSKADCEKIIYSALHHHKTVFCVMQNRYSPPSIWLKEIIDKGVLGEVYMVQLNCYWNRDGRYYKAGGWKGTSDLDGAVHRRIEDRAVINGDDLATAGGSEADAQDALGALPRVQRGAAASGAVGIDQLADLAGDAGMGQRVDHQLPLPRPIDVLPPVLDGAAAAGAEMRAERRDPLRARRDDMGEHSAVGMVSRRRQHLHGLAAERIGHVDAAAVGERDAVAEVADMIDDEAFNHMMAVLPQPQPSPACGGGRGRGS